MGWVAAFYFIVLVIYGGLVIPTVLIQRMTKQIAQLDAQAKAAAPSRQGRTKAKA